MIMKMYFSNLMKNYNLLSVKYSIHIQISIKYNYNRLLLKLKKLIIMAGAVLIRAIIK